MRTAQALIRLGGLGHFLVWNNYLFELFLRCRGTVKLILSTMFYHLCLSLFSNCINISNLNSDSLFVNNGEYKQLSTISISLNNSSWVWQRYCCRVVCHKCFIVAKQYFIKECDIRRQYSDPSYYLSDRKPFYFIKIWSFRCFFVVLKSVPGTLLRKLIDITCIRSHLTKNCC